MQGNWLIIKARNAILLIIAMLTLSQCSTATRIQTSEAAMKSFSEDIQDDYGLFLCGYSGQFKFLDDQVFFMSYDIKGSFTKPQARQLLVFTADKFLNFLNSNEKYKEINFKKNFTPKDLKIHLAFVDSNNDLAGGDDHVSLAMLYKEKLVYGYKTKFPGFFDIRNDDEESFAHARELVMNDGLPKINSNQEAISNPALSGLEYDYSREMQKMIFEFRYTGKRMQ